MNSSPAGTNFGKSHLRLARRVGVVGFAVLAAVASLSPPASATSARALGPVQGAAVDQPGAAEAAAVSAYLKSYPQMSVPAAKEAFAKQVTRKELYGLLANDTKTFGGIWFDPPTGVVHIAVTTAAAEAKAVGAARDLRLKAQTHVVSNTFADLESKAAELRSGKTALGQAAQGQVGIDVPTNRVVVAVPAGQVSGFAPQAASAGVTVIADPKANVEKDAFPCTSRITCDFTVHAGNVLWLGSPGANTCSVGFTARDANNQRYVYTAGHCNIGAGNWGTGNQSIGPIVSSVQSGSIDASIIQVTNSWFAFDHGGEIFPSFDLNFVAPTLSYIFVGEVVCLSPNFSDPTGPNFCGTVGSISDAAVLGMVRVNGLDGCPGDSGGGWYWLGSSTFRVAYGLHSRSNTGCHVAGGTSWFSPIPTVQPTWGLTVEVA
jgi:streptogrisin C